MWKWLKRIAVGLLVLVVLAIGAAAALEQWMRHRARQDFPPPGKLVEVAGRKIQIDCRGSGSPLVVLEGGGNLAGTTTWTGIQEKLAVITRVCSYSRAGLMWSDPAPGPRDGKAIADDLHAALGEAGERPPFVLAGWSLGGPYAVTYAGRYPDEVAGLVLIDPSHPDQHREQQAITHRETPSVPPGLKLAERLAWSGLLRMSPPEGASLEVRQQTAYFPTSIAAMVRSLEYFDATMAEIKISHDLGSRPLIVMTGMAPYSVGALQEIGLSPAEGVQFKQAWKRMHDDMTGWSKAGQHVLITEAGHDLPGEAPAAIVRAINAVVMAVRNGTPPTY